MKANKKETSAPVHPKYSIFNRLCLMYGELNTDQGFKDLAKHCRLASPRSIREDWVKIPAGSGKAISRLVLPAVLQFFACKKESDLYTRAHKDLVTALKQTA